MHLSRSLILQCLLACLIALTVWYIGATYVFLLLSDLAEIEDRHWRVLWDYYWQFPDYQMRVYFMPISVRGLLLVSVLIPPTLVVAAACIVHFRIRRLPLRRWRRPFDKPLIPSEHAATDNHGHAEWMTIARAKQIFDGPKYNYGGKLVGQTAAGDLIFDTCELRNGLSLEFATSGG